MDLLSDDPPSCVARYGADSVSQNTTQRFAFTAFSSLTGIWSINKVSHVRICLPTLVLNAHSSSRFPFRV